MKLFICFGILVFFLFFLLFLAEKDCNIVVDIAFIVDSSGSISRRNWKRMQAFLKDMVQEFHSGPFGARFAIVVYSTNAEVSLKFNDLQNNTEYNQKIMEVIDGLRHQRGFTFIDKALKLTRQEVFTVASGMRPNVQKVRLQRSATRWVA